MQIVGTEIEWELGEALPTIKRSLQRQLVNEQLKSADHISKHDADRSRAAALEGARSHHLEAAHRLRSPEGLSPGSRAQPVGAGSRCQPTEWAGARPDGVPDVRC
jgi:hypothetical protein